MRTIDQILDDDINGPKLGTDLWKEEDVKRMMREYAQEAIQELNKRLEIDSTENGEKILIEVSGQL